MADENGEHERTLAFAEIALTQIKALRQAATPRNYEVWYTYATGYYPSLNQAINETLRRTGTLTQKDIDDVYSTYLSPVRISDRLENVGTRVVDEIDVVMAILDEAMGAAATHSENIEDARVQLGSAKDRDAVRAVIETLVKTANDMRRDNEALEQRLSASRKEIQDLQINLETVRNESLTDPLTSLSNRKYFDLSLS